MAEIRISNRKLIYIELTQKEIEDALFELALKKLDKNPDDCGFDPSEADSVDVEIEIVDHGDKTNGATITFSKGFAKTLEDPENG